MRYAFTLEARDGFAPHAETRALITAQASAALPPDATITWDTGGEGRPMSLRVEMDLNGRWTLEALGVVIQAMNSALVHVAGWPTQTVTTVPIGGPIAVPMATGAVGLRSFAPVDDAC